jgi:protein involved in polysaccharide export with SLBB domain
MRVARLMVPILVALLAAACARQQPSYYVVDPQTGQSVPVVQQYSGPEQYVQAQQYGQPQYAQPAPAQPQYAQGGNRGLFGSLQGDYAQPQYAQPQYAPQTQYAPQPQYAPPQAPQPADGNRGLFNSRRAAQPQYAPQQSYVLQYQPPAQVAPQVAPQGGPYVAAPYGYASTTPIYQPGYTLDAGDKLRITVFGQEGISGSYAVDAGGNINLPLAGSVPARGFSTEQLAKMIGERLKQGYVREPHVTVSIEAYRPFFILGEVTTPGQYPYVPNMTAENAIAIAGGFAPRADKKAVEVTRNSGPQRFSGQVPLNYPLQPGDTVKVKERWF